MKELVIKIILSVSSLFLIIGIAVGMITEDRTAPEIRVDVNKKVTYYENEDEKSLLRGVTAEDDKEGDVTESVRISSIYRTSGKKAIVTYVAKDSENNIGKLKREVNYVSAAPEEDDVQTDADQTGQEEDQPDGGQTEQDAPVIKMRQNELTMKAGESFNVVKYVESATDVDGSDLSRNIHVKGALDPNQPGIYSLTVYAVGADGVSSNKETFTLTVEPQDAGQQ